MVERQGDQIGLRSQVAGVEIKRLTSRSETEETLGVANRIVPGDGRAGGGVPNPEQNFLGGEPDEVQMVAPGLIGQNLRRSLGLRPERDAGDRLDGGDGLRSGDRLGGPLRGEVGQGGHSAGVADLAQGSRGVADENRVRAIERGDERGHGSAIKLSQTFSVRDATLDLGPGSGQFGEDRRDGVGTGFAKTVDRVDLFLAAEPEVVNESLEPRRVGRGPDRGATDLIDQRGRIGRGRVVISQPQKRPGPRLVADPEQRRLVRVRFEEPLDVRGGLVGLADLNQVVGHLPHFKRGFRWVAERGRSHLPLLFLLLGAD